MSHACCERCQMRFTADSATYLIACPDCERPLTRVEGARRLLGFQLFDPLDLSDLVTGGHDVSPARPRPDGTRSRPM
jgi:predicted amidophosphoribosyltransferase